MSSRCRVKTTSHGYGNSINSLTDASMEGDSPHSEYISGMAAGEIGKGHSMGHADYLARVKAMEIYTGRSAPGGGAGAKGSGGGDPGLGDIKEMLGLIKGLLG